MDFLEGWEEYYNHFSNLLAINEYPFIYLMAGCWVCGVGIRYLRISLSILISTILLSFQKMIPDFVWTFLEQRNFNINSYIIWIINLGIAFALSIILLELFPIAIYLILIVFCISTFKDLAIESIAITILLFVILIFSMKHIRRTFFSIIFAILGVLETFCSLQFIVKNKFIPDFIKEIPWISKHYIEFLNQLEGINLNNNLMILAFLMIVSWANQYLW